MLFQKKSQSMVEVVAAVMFRGAIPNDDRRLSDIGT